MHQDTKFVAIYASAPNKMVNVKSATSIKKIEFSLLSCLRVDSKQATSRWSSWSCLRTSFECEPFHLIHSSFQAKKNKQKNQLQLSASTSRGRISWTQLKWWLYYFSGRYWIYFVFFFSVSLSYKPRLHETLCGTKKRYLFREPAARFTHLWYFLS